jgi:phosphoribosylglycinamide formyltransferase-1
VTDVPSPFPLGRTARLAVFASGRGSNLSALIAAFPPVLAVVEPDAAAAGAAAVAGAAACVALVVCDRAEAGALMLARAAGVPAVHLPFGRDRVAFEAAAQRELERHRIDLIALAGFMRILSPGFAATWRGRLLNVHPSLLPSFPGLHAVRQALAAGVDRSGCTVHFVDAGIDTGPAIERHAVPVLGGDDEDTLRARIQAVEHAAYPAAVRAVLRGEATFPGSTETVP